jgi:formate dehydrogenase subunit delta
VTAAKAEKLARMANQIGAFFAPMGEPAATEGVATHLRKFWTLKMISEIVDYLDTGHAGLDPTVARAVESLRSGREIHARIAQSEEKGEH